jgi:hypothetical protein
MKTQDYTPVVSAVKNRFPAAKVLSMEKSKGPIDRKRKKKVVNNLLSDAKKIVRMGRLVQY